MANVVWDALQQVGAPVWDDAAQDIAREIQRNLGYEPMQAPFINEMSQLIPPEEAEAILRRDLPPSQLNSTSDDYTDMCWHAPTARFYVARPALRGGPYPAWIMNALGGIPATIDPMIQCAAKVLATSAIRLLEDGTARDAAMAEFRTRIDGAAMIPPLCDYDPPSISAGPNMWTPPGAVTGGSRQQCRAHRPRVRARTSMQAQQRHAAHQDQAERPDQIKVEPPF